MASRRKRISPMDFDRAVEQALSEFGEEVYDVMNKVIEDATISTTLELQQVRRFAPGGRPSGAYSSDWTFEDRRVGRFKTVSTVYNSEHYQLAHLLEFGHAGKNGSRKTWRVPGYEHIRPINDKVEKEIIEDFRKMLGGMS